MSDTPKTSPVETNTAEVPASKTTVTPVPAAESKTQTSQAGNEDLPEPMDLGGDATPTLVNTMALGSGGLSPPPSLSAQEASKTFPIPRSQSPAKRSASEMDGEDDTGYTLSPSNTITENTWTPSIEGEFTGSGATPPAAHSSTALSQLPSSSVASVLDSATGTNVSTAPSSVYENPSNTDLDAAGVPTLVDPALDGAAVIRSVSPPPSIEDQLTTVYLGIHSPPREGDDYCVISGKWLRKFLSYNKDSDIQLTKEEAEGDLGPIDNSDLLDANALAQLRQQGAVVLNPQPISNNSITNSELISDEFSPLLRGTMGEDFEAIPLDTYLFLANIHGVVPGSPSFKRKACNTVSDTSSHSASNIEVELYPPTFTFYKLRDPSAETSHASLTAGTRPPAKVIASRSVRAQYLLKKAKVLLGIELPKKVRLWRLPEPAAGPTQTASSSPSRSSSPANGSPPASEKGMIMDMAAFLNLEAGAQRELIEILEDQTNNSNYNGKMTINTAGLGFGGEFVLEELVDGQWPTEKVSKSLKAVGAKQGIVAKIGSIVRRGSATSSRSSSPARSQPTTNATASGSGTGSGIMSRGREKKPGRAPGTCGLQNLGNTCYMNSALQCLRNCEELSRYFLSGQFKSELNPSNPLGHGGNIARSYSNLLGNVFSSTCPSSYAPREFKGTIGRFGSSFSGYGQQDTQEFLAFLLDGLHEDLNRIHKKPYIEKPESTDDMVNDEAAISALADKCWDIYKKRNDSAVADLFGGLYKSTLVCPTCNKVSITFDPFMDLTLPLPVENVWSREILFFRKGGEVILRVPVDMEKTSNIRALKEYVGRKFNIDPKKLVASEVYKNKFFKHYEDLKGVAGEIQPNDLAAIYEVDDIPTNYPPVKTRGFRSMITRHDSDDEAQAASTEKLLVPIFNRLANKTRNGEYFGLPFFILLNREEQKDFDTILLKVCEGYQSQTSRSILSSEDSDDEDTNASGTDSPDNDNVVVNAGDEAVDGGKRVKESDGDDGYVDVEMEDVEVKEKKAKKTKGYSARRLNALRSLFTLRIVAKANNGDGIHTGWGDLTPGLDLTSRIRDAPPTPPALPPRKKSFLPSERPGRRGSDESEEDYDEDEPYATSSQAQQPESDEESPDAPNYSFTNKPDFIGPHPPASFYGKAANNKQKKAMKNNGPPARNKRSPSEASSHEQQPLLKFGEALVCDWTPESYDALFGGEREEFKGKPLWDKPVLFQDEDLESRRRARESRRNRGVHLEDCLAEFAKEEILSETDPWFCPRCKEHRRASKKFELWKSPDILVIHLKRFSSSRNSRDKIDALIDFPIEGLDLTDRVGKKEEGKELIYDLFAVDNHYGGLGGGHYTAFARNYEDGKWYYFDDSSVSATSPKNAITSAAYLLFYRRRSSKPLGGPMYERILGDSQDPSQEDLGDGGNDPGNDSGISDNSPSSSPLRFGPSNRRNSSDISGSSSPLVASSSRAAVGGVGSSLLSGTSSSAFSSATTSTTRFGGAGSSSTIFGNDSASGYISTGQSSSGFASTELFGSLIDRSAGEGSQGVPMKSVNFTFGSGERYGAGSGTSSVDSASAAADIAVGTSSSSSTAGDVGDVSDVDADVDGDLEELLADGVNEDIDAEADDDDDVVVSRALGVQSGRSPGLAVGKVQAEAEVDRDGDVEMEEMGGVKLPAGAVKK